ncbi:MAG: hypothetical protein QXE31_04445 [Candidatus Woesearchaeota archaeon]
MKKNAYLEADLISFFIIFIFIVLFVISLNFIKLSEFKLNENQDKLHNDLILVNILRYPTEEGTFADTLLQDYYENDFTKSKHYLNKLFFDAFDEKICYKFSIGTKLFHESENCKKISEFIKNFDANAKIPVNNEYLYVKLFD